MGSLKYFIIILSIFFLAGCSEQKNETGGNIQSAQKPFTEFLFVGMVNNNSGLYVYDAERKRIKNIWSAKNEKIIELNYSDDRSSVFFLTARSFGERANFPFIDKVKLYTVDENSGEINFIKDIGSGLQVFARWETDNSFKIILNYFDKTVPNYVQQQTQIFNTFGKQILDETKTFDIVNEGYPLPPQKKRNIISPQKNYLLGFSSEKNIQYFIEELKGDKKYLIADGDQSINQVEWPAEEKYLIFSTINILPENNSLKNEFPETSSLFVYSIDEKKIKQKWEGGGIKSFFITVDLLIFDDGFGENSLIKIYNFEQDKMIDVISVKGGCGLRNIPAKPEYSQL
jgi:hypothetical protein